VEEWLVFIGWSGLLNVVSLSGDGFLISGEGPEIKKF
jgi:hypothetical protein